jgi:hypothetical protein
VSLSSASSSCGFPSLSTTSTFESPESSLEEELASLEEDLTESSLEDLAPITSTFFSSLLFLVGDLMVPLDDSSSELNIFAFSVGSTLLC